MCCKNIGDLLTVDQTLGPCINCLSVLSNEGGLDNVNYGHRSSQSSSMRKFTRSLEALRSDISMNKGQPTNSLLKQSLLERTIVRFE